MGGAVSDAGADTLFETVAERAPIMLWMGDDTGKCVYLNAAQREFWGVELPNLSSFDWGKTVHPDDVDTLMSAFGPAMEEKRAFQVEARYRRSDGAFRTLRTRAEPRFDTVKRFIGMIGVNEDVTEQREAEKELLAQSLVSAILNKTGSAIAAKLDLSEVVQIVTDAGVELTGAQFGAFFYNVLNAAGESYMLYTLSGVPREAFSKFPMPRNTAIFAPTFAGEGTVRSDDILKDPRYGHNVPYKGMPEGHLPVRSYLAVPVRSRSGEVLGGLFFGHSQPAIFDDRAEKLMDGLAGQASIAIDNARLFDASQKELAQRRAAEEKLQELNAALEERHAEEAAQRGKAEERFRLLVQSVTDYAIYMLDAQGRVSSWNPGAERFKGYSAAEIIGNTSHAFTLKKIALPIFHALHSRLLRGQDGLRRKAGGFGRTVPASGPTSSLIQFVVKMAG